MEKESRYTVNVAWSDENETFIAMIPELPGCAADGVTEEEAITNVEMMIQEWVEVAKELGRPIPDGSFAKQ